MHFVRRVTVAAAAQAQGNNGAFPAAFMAAAIAERKGARPPRLFIHQPNGKSFGASGDPAMTDLIRFGRRVPLPSSVQIRHDLLGIGRGETASRPGSASQIQPGAAPEPASCVPTLRDPPKAI